MPMSAGEIEQMIQGALPDADVRIEDLRGMVITMPPISFPKRSGVSHGWRSTSWFMPRCRGGWGQNCALSLQTKAPDQA